MFIIDLYSMQTAWVQCAHSIHTYCVLVFLYSCNIVLLYYCIIICFGLDIQHGYSTNTVCILLYFLGHLMLCGNMSPSQMALYICPVVHLILVMALAYDNHAGSAVLLGNYTLLFGKVMHLWIHVLVEGLI